MGCQSRIAQNHLSLTHPFNPPNKPLIDPRFASVTPPRRRGIRGKRGYKKWVDVCDSLSRYFNKISIMFLLIKRNFIFLLKKSQLI